MRSLPVIKNPQSEVMDVKYKVLSALKSAEGYVSGEQLSNTLGVTRSAVWKAVNALKAEGYVVDSVRNKGYRLLASPDKLDHEEIVKGLQPRVVGKKVILLDTVDSTNQEVKRLARQGEAGGTVVAAEHQTAGKGRFGRSWGSGSGGLFFTLLLRPELPPSDIASITLAAGYAVCLAVRDYTGVDARIKWPNDVIVGSKKICGILTEMAAQSDRIDYVAIGIGINVNDREFPEELRQKATSLRLETGKELDRSRFFGAVLSCLDEVLSRFLVSLSIDDLNSFKSLCATLGRRVTVERSDGQLCGVATDVTAGGELIVTGDDGTRMTVGSGEVTVQGIY